MLGVGGSVKRIFKASRSVILDAAHEGRAEAFRYRALRSKIFNPDYYIDVVPNLRIVFVHVPKAGSTHIRSILARSANINTNLDLIHDRRISGLQSPRDVTLKKFFQVVDGEGSLVFTVVRHPVSRLLSCYKNKFAHFPLNDRNQFNEKLRPFIPAADLRRLDPFAPIPLQTFIEAACASCSSSIEAHWSRMVDVLPLERLRFSHIGRLDKINETFIMMQAMGIPEEAFPSVVQNRTSQVTPKITESQRRAIADAYHSDFQAFGFEPDVDL
jgi:hypothetical protein